MTKKKILTRQARAVALDERIRQYMADNNISDYAEGLRQYSEKYPDAVRSWQQSPAAGRETSIEVDQ